MTRHVIVTGAAGFLGRHVVHSLLACPEVSHVTATDRVSFGPSLPRLDTLVCPLDAPAVRDAVKTADTVIHLAAMLGGAAEETPTAARKVNIDAALDLAAACKPETRFVFASSLAVLGSTPDSRAPTMVYGAHKAMVEIALETATRRGELDAISLRPGGIVARPDAGAGLKSAFLSRLFWAVARGDDISLPVTPDATSWLSSVRTVAAHFVHAARTPDLGPTRSLTLPMTHCRVGDLVAALRAAYPDSPSQITYAPDPAIMDLFGTARPLDFTAGLRAGFRPDTDLATLVAAALEQHGDHA